MVINSQETSPEERTGKRYQDPSAVVFSSSDRSATEKQNKMNKEKTIHFIIVIQFFLKIFDSPHRQQTGLRSWIIDWISSFCQLIVTGHQLQKKPVDPWFCNSHLFIYLTIIGISPDFNKQIYIIHIHACARAHTYAQDLKRWDLSLIIQGVTAQATRHQSTQSEYTWTKENFRELHALSLLQNHVEDPLSGMRPSRAPQLFQNPIFYVGWFHVCAWVYHQRLFQLNFANRLKLFVHNEILHKIQKQARQVFYFTIS